jgi:hypothetical protein
VFLKKKKRKRIKSPGPSGGTKINSNLNFLTLQNMQPKREDSKFKFSKRNLLNDQPTRVFQTF